MPEEEKEEILLKEESEEFRERTEIEAEARAASVPAAGLRDVETMYMRDIKSQPMLSNEETVQLIREIRAIQNNPELHEEWLAKRHRIINANMRLVAAIAIRKFRGKGMELTDLLSEGSFAIAAAIDHFDLDRETQFSTCLYYWIKQKLQLAVIKYGTDIRVPTWVDVKIKQMYLHRLQLATEMGIDEESVPPAAVAASMGKDSQGRETTEADVISLMEIYHKKIAKKIDSSINNTRTKDAGDSDDPLELADDAPTRLELRVLDDKQKLMLKVIEMIGNPKQEEVLKMRYGFVTGKEMSLAEIGRYYESLGETGCSRERIRQVEQKALERLRSPYFIKKMQQLGLID